jgi:hypothetical protein
VVESERFCERSVGDPEDGTSSATDFPFRPTGVDTTSICDEAMDDESRTFFMIQPMFYYCWPYERIPSGEPQMPLHQEKNNSFWAL